MDHRKSHICSFVDKSTPKTFRATFKCILFPDQADKKIYVVVSVKGKIPAKYDILQLVSWQLDYVADTFDVFTFPRQSSVDTIKFIVDKEAK